MSSCNILESDYWNLVWGYGARRGLVSRRHLTSRIVGTTLMLLASGQMPILNVFVTCCREVDMKPPTQTAAATADVDVRASA